MKQPQRPQSQPQEIVDAPVPPLSLIHIFYGKELAVWLQAHLRGEMRFESAAALRARVLYDRQLVADYYQK